MTLVSDITPPVKAMPPAGQFKRRLGRLLLRVLAAFLLILGTGFLALTIGILARTSHGFTVVTFQLNDEARRPAWGVSFSAAAASAAQFALAPEQSLLGEEQNRINILVLGMAGQPNPAPYLTDTILLISLEPATGRTALISIPRDLYVKSPLAPYGGRLNSLYEIGRLTAPDQPESAIVEKAAAITGLKIPYWLAFDLNVVTKIVDALGGIDVFVPEAIDDPQFPGANFAYEHFALAAGFQHLDGATAAKYVRSRYSPGGDYDRVKRQREVLEAVARKVKALNPFWNFPQLINIYQDLTGHIATNLTMADGRRLYELLKDSDGKKVYDASLTADPASGVLKELTTSYGAAVLVPKAGYENYAEIQALFKNIFEQF